MREDESPKVMEEGNSFANSEIARQSDFWDIRRLLEDHLMHDGLFPALSSPFTLSAAPSLSLVFRFLHIAISSILTIPHITMSDHRDASSKIPPRFSIPPSTVPPQSTPPSNPAATDVHRPSIETRCPTDPHPKMRQSIRRDADDILQAIENATNNLIPFIDTLATFCHNLGGLAPHLREVSRVLKRDADQISRLNTQHTESEGAVSGEMADVAGPVNVPDNTVTETTTSTNLPTAVIVSDEFPMRKDSSKSKAQTAGSTLDAEGANDGYSSDSSVALMNKRRKTNRSTPSVTRDANTGGHETSQRSQPVSNDGQACPRNTDLDTTSVDPGRRPTNANAPDKASSAMPSSVQMLSTSQNPPGIASSAVPPSEKTFSSSSNPPDQATSAMPPSVQMFKTRSDHNEIMGANLMPTQTETSNRQLENIDSASRSRISTNMIGRHPVGPPARSGTSMPRSGVFQPRPGSVTRVTSQSGSTIHSLGSHAVSPAQSGTPDAFRGETWPRDWFVDMPSRDAIRTTVHSQRHVYRSAGIRGDLNAEVAAIHEWLKRWHSQASTSSFD